MRSFKFKKWIIRGALVTSVVFFSSAIVSCADQSINNKIKKNEIYKLNNFKELDFNIFKTIGKNEPLFLGSINYTAYSQGVSFIFNILKGLGWNWEDSEKIRKLYDYEFDFSTIDINKKSNSGFQKDHKLLDIEIELQKYFSLTSGETSLNQFIKDKATNKALVSKLYNQIKSLVHINKKYEKGNKQKEKENKQKEKDHMLKADASTKVEIELSPNFHRLNIKQQLQEIANKLNTFKIAQQIFQRKKYAYSWSGTVLDKLGFQIQKDKMVLWHMSDHLPYIVKNITDIRKFDLNLQKIISNKQLTVKERKNLSQVVIEPLGAYLPLPSRVFLTNLNLKNLKTQEDIKRMWKWFARNLNPKPKDKTSENTNKFHKLESELIAYYNSFIDAANPGTTIFKMFNGKKYDFPRYPLRTYVVKNRIQTFYKLKDEQKIKDMVDLIFYFIELIKKEYLKITKFIKDSIKRFSPLLIAFSEYIKNNNITREDIEKQFNKYNNGSHYMLAVEIFLRGMINIPHDLLRNFNIHKGVKTFIGTLVEERKWKEIIGTVNMSKFAVILLMIFSATPKSNEIDHKNPYYFYHFDPSTSNYYNFDNDQEKIQEYHFLKNLTAKMKKGKEISAKI